MMQLPFDGYEMLSHPDKLLAIVGGAALGGFSLAFLVQLFVRGWTGQQMPRWVTMTLRATGGLLSGWLVALWMFAGGGGGMGGPGGFGFGTGTHSGNDNASVKAKDKEETVRKEDDLTREVQTLYVEVLGEKTLKELDEGRFDPLRCYRIETPKGPRLMTLKEVVDYLKQRLTEKPTLKAVTIVLYKDSPSRWVKRVKDLEDEVGVLTPADGERLSVGYEQPKKNAPRN
jgi:hypothetical protein